MKTVNSGRTREPINTKSERQIEKRDLTPLIFQSEINIIKLREIKMRIIVLLTALVIVFLGCAPDHQKQNENGLMEDCLPRINSAGTYEFKNSDCIESLFGPPEKKYSLSEWENYVKDNVACGQGVLADVEKVIIRATGNGVKIESKDAVEIWYYSVTEGDELEIYKYFLFIPYKSKVGTMLFHVNVVYNKMILGESICISRN